MVEVIRSDLNKTACLLVFIAEMLEPAYVNGTDGKHGLIEVIILEGQIPPDRKISYIVRLHKSKEDSLNGVNFGGLNWFTKGQPLIIADDEDNGAFF